MEPYYDEDGITIYHGDALEVLPHVELVDAVLTDPPYNVGIEYGTADDRRLDYADWCAEWFAICQVKAPAIALTPGIANLGLWHRIAQPDWTMSWQKPAAMGRCWMGFNNWEPVMYWGPSRNLVDVVVAPIVPDPSVDGHPCPKPLKWALGLLAVLGGTSVCDPFMGSGTTLRAAKDLGRKAIGIEIEEKYCEIAVKRLAQMVLDVEAA